MTMHRKESKSVKLNRLIGLVILVILLSACSGPDDGSQPSISNGHSSPEVQSDPMKETIEQRCKEITSMYYDLYASADKTETQNQWDDPVMSQSSIDAIENLLIDAGLDVVDTNGVYPSHLTTADRFYNFWYDVTVEKTYFPDGKFSGEKLEKFEILKDKIIDEVYKIIEEQREIAKKNPDKFYILTFAPRVSIHNAGEYKDGDWEYTYSNLAAVNIYTRLFEMPFELYEEVYRDKLIETYRYEAFAMYGGMYYLFDEKVLVDGATCTFNADIRLYDYINNIEIKKLTEVFNEDSKYMDVINNNVKNYLRDKYEYEDLKIEELIKTINCELKGSSIEVTIPSIENFSRIVYFYEFEKDMFKSFEE